MRTYRSNQVDTQKGVQRKLHPLRSICETRSDFTSVFQASLELLAAIRIRSVR